MDFVRIGVPQALVQAGLESFQRSLNWTCVLLGVWCVISTAEWIGQLGLFDDRGLLSWRIMSLQTPWTQRSSVLPHVFGRRGVAVILMMRLVCGAAALLPLPNMARIAVLAAIVVTGVLFKLRKWLSDDGADQMGQIVSIGALITAVGLSMQDLLFAFAGTLLIAGQLTIAYFLAGAVKLISYEWRSGRALAGVMGTQGFGHDFAARAASSSATVSVVFCWLLIAVEMAFPLAVLSPPPVLAAFLAVFALFHVATALFMGLNTYVWSFLGAYPSVLLLNSVVIAAMH